MKVVEDEIYFLDGGTSISEKDVARVEELKSEFAAPTWNRQQRRQFKKASRKRGRGFTR